MPGPAFSEGETVSLHPIEEEDYEFIQRGRNHPSTRVPLTDTTIRRSEDVAELFEDGAEYHFLICADGQRESADEANSAERSSADHSSGRSPREDGDDGPVSSANGDSDGPEPVGVVAFGWVRDDTNIGSLMYWVAPEHRGQGYVTEGTGLFLDYAFAECGFNKVTARVAESNDASANALEGLGFEREGRGRKECFIDGEWEDMFMYGLLAEEWLDD